jgi:hypothetical protein
MKHFSPDQVDSSRKNGSPALACKPRIAPKRYQIGAVLVCLVFWLMLVLQSSVVYADPTATPFVVATSPYQNLMPSPTPLPTSNATPMALFEENSPHQMAYDAVNIYRYFNQDSLFDWLQFLLFGMYVFRWLFRLVKRIKSTGDSFDTSKGNRR